MKKLLIGIGFVVATALNLFAQEQANKPDYKDGDFWQYKVTQKGFRTQSTSALDGVYELTYKALHNALVIRSAQRSALRFLQTRLVKRTRSRPDRHKT